MRRTLVLASMLVALAVSACGSSSSTSSAVTAGTYVKSVCTAFHTWLTGVASSENALNSNASKDAIQVKAAIQRFFDTASTETAAALSTIRTAGIPDVPNGKKISTEFVSTFEQLESAFTAGKSRAASLPTNDPTAFKASVDTLGNTVRSSVSGLSSLNSLQSPELEAAAKKEPACSSLGA